MALAFILATVALFGATAQDSMAPCKKWFVEPFLFNNHVSDSNLVTYFENYTFHYKEFDTTKLIPDTLKIKLLIIPSLEVFDNEVFESPEYMFKSYFFYRYGNKEDSYVLFNAQVSDTIILFDQSINFKDYYELIKLGNNEELEKIVPVKSIPLKSMLIKDGVNLKTEPWNYRNGKPLYLNQIVVCSYFCNNKGEIICSSEFILPINGAYNHSYRGVIEY